MNAVNVIGHVSGNLGISVTARSLVRMLLERDLNVAILDIDPGANRHGFDNTFAALTVSSAAELPNAVNIFVFPPAALAARVATESIQQLMSRQGSFNVAFSMWELTVLPKSWRLALECFDVVVGESEFIRHAFEFNLSHGPVLHAEHPLYVPPDLEDSRKRFGLPETGVLFITAFEPHSDRERKNPGGAVDAFIGLGGDLTDAHLVVKVNNARTGQDLHPAVQALQRTCSNNPRVHLITDSLTYRDALTLYNSCDVVVALHRSEGLGLVPMEAMLLGKPVIATAWSGNMSYMNHQNSCLVPYRLVPARGSVPAYKRDIAGLGATWADPDLSVATAWMRTLTQDANLRSAIGARAKIDIDRYQTRAAAAPWLDEVEALHAQRVLLQTHSKLSASLARLGEERKRLERRAQWRGAGLRRIYDRYIGWRFERAS